MLSSRRMVTLEQITQLLATFKVELKTELKTELKAELKTEFFDGIDARFNAIDARFDRIEKHMDAEFEGVRESIEFIKDNCVTREDLRLESNRIIGIIDAERMRHNKEHSEMWTAIKRMHKPAANA